MKLNRLLLVSIILLAVLTFGAVNAADNAAADDMVVVDDGGSVEVTSSADEIDLGGEITAETSTDDVEASDNAADDNVTYNSDIQSKLGASSDNDVLGDDYEIITPSVVHERGWDSGVITTGTYRFVGEFSDDEFPSFFLIDGGSIIDASDAKFINIGIKLMGDVQITGLNMTASKYLEDDQAESPGAILYMTGDDNVVDGLTITYSPEAYGDAYGIYVNEANNFQILNSNVVFTGSSYEEYYEYAMKIINSNQGLIQGNTIRANLPILNVDYGKGEPGLDTDLVLNTGIKDSTEIDIIDNIFIAEVTDSYGDFPTLDCIMVENCDGVNIIGNTISESDFHIEEGTSNYLNVLDMYYSSNVLVQDNQISVETTGGAENAGTAYPIQLTGPYENVVIDGNELYANCGGPALGIYSQNYYGNTEILVQNNIIDVTGLPTLNSWGLVSGIELQDNVARVYNNTITTRSVNGNFEEGMNLYGISYAQFLNDNHCYDIQNNTIETEGQYTIYLLKAEDTVVTGNYLISSTGEGDDTVEIRDASGNTVIENNYGPSSAPDNIVTPENFFEFFDDEGFLLDSVTFDELIFKGDFSNLVEAINIASPITITGDDAVLNDIAIYIISSDVTLNDLTLVANSALGSLIFVEGCDNVNLINLTIDYTAPEGEEAVAIDLYAVNDVSILNSTIFFESHVTTDEIKGIAIQAVETENVIIDNNDITAKLPCVYVNTYDDDYYLMGSNNVNPVRLKDCNNLKFTNNYINSTTNDYSADFPTIQSIYIIGCSNSLIDHNNISMIDEMTPEGMDNYLYGIDFGHNYNVTFSYNNFIMFTRGGQDQHGTAYAFQGVESTVNIIGNNITSISNGPNLGIYVASMFGEASTLYIADNFINVTGCASPSGNWALVSGIEIQNGDAQIYNNTIYTYNVNEYQDGSYMYGISYAQWMYGDRSFDIQNNTVYTEGKYTISIINASSFHASGNTLYAHELTGDESIFTGECSDVEIGDNFPANTLTNIVTNENFHSFFDENGNLLADIEFDELIFQGEFSDLVNYITLDRPITITGDDAVLYDMAFIIAGEGITLDNMTLNAEIDLGNLIDIAGENAVISNMNLNYIASEAACVINVYPGANGAQILSNNICFESTVDEYSAEDVTSAICVNSGISLFDDEADPITGLVIDSNSIMVSLPAFLADVYENEYYVMGLSAVNGVRINGAEDFEFTNNLLDVATNRLDRTTPTYQAMYVASSSGLIDGNDINMIDTFTPAGKDVYLYAMEILYDEDLIISNNNFIMSTNGGKDEAGSAYAIVAIASDFSIISNNITTVSNGPNLAIYFPSQMGSPCDAIITGNFMNVTGLATSAHDTGLVSGIEVQTGSFEIKENTIYTYNIGDYAEDNYIFGISYAQSGSNSDLEIINNTIYTEGHYTVSLKSANDATITDNYLVSTDLCGDESVYIGSGSDNTVENNLPIKELANVSVAADPAWIGTDATVTVTVPNATGTVTIVVNGKSYDVELVDGVATKEIPAEDLVAGENTIEATYYGPEFASNSAVGTVFVLDGVVTQDTYIYYFNQDDAGKFFDYVPEGATLDFQGSIINPDQSVNIWFNVNKPVNIVSTTDDAYIDLNTTAGSLTGDNPGNRFTVSFGGSGSNITGLNFHNTQLWVANTHNVVLDKISNVIEDQRVGSGVGATSVRENCTYVTVKNSYFYTRNNGGSSSLVMAWADYCTFDNNTIVVEGNVGNMIYLTTFNVNVPSGVVANVHNNITNNHIYSPNSASAICWALVLSGSDNLIENNTIEYKGTGITTQFGNSASPNNTYRNNVLLNGSAMSVLPDSIVYNNYVSGALTVGARSVAYNNTIDGKLTVAQGAKVYDNTVAGGVATSGTDSIIENNTIVGAVTINKVGTTFVGNNVTGTVTVSANNNVIKGNNITTTGNYAVDLGSKTGNTVTDNYLVASELKGDAAVKFSNANNVVENNTPLNTIATVLSGDDLDMSYKDGSVWAVTLTDANGDAIAGVNVAFGISGKTYYVATDDAGVASLPINLIPGSYAINATFDGDELYEASFVEATVTVDKAVATLSGDDLDMSYKDGSVWAVTLTDANGDAIAGVKVAFGISGKTYYIATDDAGVASLPINLQPGTYEISASFSNSKYEAESITATITVDKLVPVLSAEDLTMTYKDGSAWAVTLTDANGNAIANTNVKFTILGKSYNVKTGADGIASLPINLAVGTYDISAKFEGSSTLEATEINSTIVVNPVEYNIVAEDVNMTYQDGTSYNVQLVDGDGNAVALAGKSVKITISGKSYYRQTDANGIASLPINLKAGTYEIAAEYDGKEITNTIVVNQA